MKKQSGGTRLRVVSLFELAEAVGLFHGVRGAEAAIEEFREIAQDYRHVVKAEGQVAWLTYLLRLLFTCPVLLQRPSGLEWVTDDLQWALRHRKLSPEVNRGFWKAMKEVRGLLPGGRPGDKARDLFRSEWLLNIMYPVTTHPKLGLVRTKKRVSKTKAVTELADMEERWTGRRPDERVIWKSLERVETHIGKLKAQLEIARTNQAVRAIKPRSREQSGQGIL